METSGSDHWTTDVYMLPQPGSHLNSVSAPAFQEMDTMGGEVAQPDYIVDQNLYYTPAVAPANYYGYIYTGFESPGEWDDHYRGFGVDGQDLHYQGLQTEGLQYAYYTPSGYAQSPYSPYNTYVPGAVIGADSSVIGAQQYASSPAYQHPVISPGYLPVVFQPGADIIPSISPGPSLANSGGSATNRPENQVVQYTLPSSSAGSATSGQKEAVHAATGYSPLVPKSEEASHAYKKNMVPGNMPSSSVLQNSQGRSLPMPVQAADKFMQGNEIPQHGPLKVNVPSHGNFTELGSNAYGWVTVDAPQPRMQFPGFLKSGGGTPDMLGEKNRGPRASRTKAQWSSVLVGKAFTNKAGVVDAEGNIVINTDRYNRSDFPVNYPGAKFFVIKSYSEDDVHKSIKYNVWSSTPNGNRRLDAAYEEAKRISGGNLSNCPIFLFFSVNASGQFCGVAEMAGPVDFHKDMDFWQQDKWTGSFPVKWHIVKDVPNTSFRHIILENNENKPVTNSRDTQEILFIPGMNMLTIFKDSLLRTSILDDFMYYEERQKIMYEEKLRLLGRSYEQPAIFANPPSFSPARQYVTIKEPYQRSERRPVSQSIVETKNKAPDNKVPSGVKNKTLDNQVPSGAKNNASDNQVPSGAKNNASDNQVPSGAKNNASDNQVPSGAKNNASDNQVPSGSKNKTPDTQAPSDTNKAHASNAITEKEAQVVPNGKSEVEPSASNVKKGDDSGMSSSNAEREGKRESTECDRDVGSIVKISSLSIDEKEDGNINEPNESTAAPAVTSTMELPNVGSEPVKANGFVADTFTVGTIPIDTKSMENKPSPTG